MITIEDDKVIAEAQSEALALRIQSASSAARRASMDLTRALADFRRAE
jgi:hypothetical protein